MKLLGVSMRLRSVFGSDLAIARAATHWSILSRGSVQALVVATAFHRFWPVLMRKAVISDSPLLVIPPKTAAMTGQLTRAAAYPMMTPVRIARGVLLNPPL